MLSEKSAAIVRATLPAVGGAINEITERFYPRMFAAHPELLRDLFNRGNQAAGTQKQALAGSIATFATYLVEHPDQRPDLMLRRIAHKHASLGVLPEQYPIVREHLFAAIVDVLGDAITPEVAAAWDEVYWLMANALIDLERRLYEETQQTGWRDWKVVERIEETPDVAVFKLRPADDGPVPGYRAGQYVSVRVQLPDGARQARQYSLTAAPGSPERQFAVKRVLGDDTAPDGEVSTHLHQHVRVGDVVELSAPYGDLVLEDDDAPLLLASAGIGVTPMIAMLEQLALTGHSAPVTVLHADRSPAAHAFRSDHEAYAAKLPDARTVFFYEKDAEGAGRPGLADLTGIDVPAGTHAYLCGPLPFMRSVREQLLAKGVSPANIHYEIFGPDLWLAQPAA
ncbi:globin domain-containing protein [Streptomyces thermoalcalitolerans]|uniref:nitric oxide dioxygenase n=1 Tax=Streptomyces thermoalcalitolerans TaxID=65605 RepID=A0ABN1NF47_9ACTN